MMNAGAANDFVLERQFPVLTQSLENSELKHEPLKYFFLESTLLICH